MLAMVRGLAEMTHMKEEIAGCFKTKDLGKVRHFCRFETDWPVPSQWHRVAILGLFLNNSDLKMLIPPLH